MDSRAHNHRIAPRALFHLIALAAIFGLYGCGGPVPSGLSGLSDSSPGTPPISTGNIVRPKSLNQISINRDTLDFGANLEQRWVDIEFDGDPALIYVINGEPWADSRIERGSGGDASIRLTVTIDRSQLSIGEHSAKITVGAAGSNSVDLAIHVVAADENGGGGALTISPQTLNFGRDETLLSTVLGNTTDTPLAFTVESSVAWAQASIRGGRVDAGRNSLEVAISRQGLFPRTYFGWIEIRADNGQLGVINLIMDVPEDAGSDPAPDNPAPDNPAPDNPVNPTGIPNPDTPPDPERMSVVWFHSAAGWSIESLRLALASGRVTHVVVKGMHRNDMSINNQHVQAAIRVVQQSDAALIWTRNLWPYYNQEGIQQSDFFTPEYYERELDQLAQEAELIGADFTGIDPEPYAESYMKPLIKGGGGLVPLSAIHKQQMIRAVDVALETAPRADYTLVAGTNLEDNAYNFLSRLARLRVNQSTYYLNERKIKHLTFDYELFGANLRTTPDRPDHPDFPYFTVETLFERDDLYPDAIGLFLFAGKDDALAVAQALNDYSGN